MGWADVGARELQWALTWARLELGPLNAAHAIRARCLSVQIAAPDRTGEPVPIYAVLMCAYIYTEN